MRTNLSAAPIRQATRAAGPLTPGDFGYSTLPAGLTPEERHAYRTGFDRGARAYAKKNPAGQCVGHDPLTGDVAPAAGTAARRQLAVTLAAMGKAYRADRHDTAHRAGMSSLRSYWTRRGMADRAAAYAPAKATRAPRKTRAAAPVDVVDVAPAPVDVPATPAPLAAVPDIITPDPAPDTAPASSPAVDAPAVVDGSLGDTHALVRAAVTAGTVPDPAHGRRAARRALAAVLRSAGIAPAGHHWQVACAAAGLTGDAS